MCCNKYLLLINITIYKLTKAVTVCSSSVFLDENIVRNISIIPCGEPSLKNVLFNCYLYTVQRIS